MSTRYLKTRTIATAGVLVAALGGSSPLWAGATAGQSADTANVGGAVGGSGTSRAVAADRQLAMMMDGMGMGMKDKEKKGAMGGMGDMGGMPSTGSMPSTPSPGSMSDPMATPSNSDMMGRTRGSMQAQQGMSKGAPIARLPGFPGAPRLFHVGASGFFLDQQIAFSNEQQTALNRIKDKTLLDRTGFDRRIDDSEKDLFALTAMESPDAVKVDSKVRAIEKLRGDQRLAFIRGVGEAGKVLTSGQQAAVLGTTLPAGSAPVPAAGNPATMPATPTPMPAAAMPMKME